MTADLRYTSDQVELPPTFRYQLADTGCWLWLGYCDRNGYARIYDRTTQRIEWAHRYSYRAHKGQIPHGYEIDHTCQQTRCVNPGHLDAVTKVEHVARTFARLGKGERHLAAAHLRRLGVTYAEIAEALGYAGKEGARAAIVSAVAKGLIDADEIPEVRRLTDVERDEIAELVALDVPQAVVAELYGVHASQVSRVSRGLTSGHRRDGAA